MRVNLNKYRTSLYFMRNSLKIKGKSFSQSIVYTLTKVFSVFFLTNNSKKNRIEILYFPYYQGFSALTINCCTYRYGDDIRFQNLSNKNTDNNKLLG